MARSSICQLLMKSLHFFVSLFLLSGLSIHTFHGNFFVRSTDLVSLPNVSPDSGFSMQIDIEDSLTDSNLAVFQSALLYTSTKGKCLIQIMIRTLSKCFAVTGNITGAVGIKSYVYVQKGLG